MVARPCNGSISPIRALFIKSMMPDSNNIAFLAGYSASVPRYPALSPRLRLGKTWRQNRTKEFLMAAYLRSAAFLRDVPGHHAVPVGAVAFLVRLADGADVVPAAINVIVQILQDQIGRIGHYNQSFMYRATWLGR